MPENVPPQKIVQKIRQTFALLQDTFASTPLEPPRAPEASVIPVNLQTYLDLLAAPETFHFPLTMLDRRIGRIAPTRDDGFYGGAAPLTLASALRRYPQLVVLGAPGSGKSSLLAHLAKTHARALINPNSPGPRLLPVILSLHEAGRHMETANPAHAKNSTARLPAWLTAAPVPALTVETALEDGSLLLLLDGLNEVPNPELRERLARQIAEFIQIHPTCRCVVTTRPLAEFDPAGLGPQFGWVQLSDLLPAQSRAFARAWLRQAQTDQPGDNTIAEAFLTTLKNNPGRQALAGNPFLLSLALRVHSNRTSTPQSRPALLDDALQLLAEDEKALRALEEIAFWMHSQRQLELTLADLRDILPAEWFTPAGRVPEKFPEQLNPLGDILRQTQPGKLAFTHFIFQEYLAARALARQANGPALALERLTDPWWHTSIVWVAAILGERNPLEVEALIRGLLASKTESGGRSGQFALFAANCLLEADPALGQRDLIKTVIRELKKQARAPLARSLGPALRRKAAVLKALARLGAAGQSAFWQGPYGEPEWVTIPQGKFWMGAGAEARSVFLPEFQLARTPVTNAQYALYLSDSGAAPPEEWREGRFAPGLDAHPVVNVSWHEAQAYCAWLGQKCGKNVCLPSEAEWEKAARGDQDQRPYPWGTRAGLYANTSELGLGETTPVGLFPGGASPFGLLDMLGNVREWTRSQFDGDGPPDAEMRVLRGGSYYFDRSSAHCSFRHRHFADFRFANFGFRVAISTQEGQAP
jgi:formylglycine-generating enzyme required for sulfatase activity